MLSEYASDRICTPCRRPTAKLGIEGYVFGDGDAGGEGGQMSGFGGIRLFLMQDWGSLLSDSFLSTRKR